MKKTHHRKNQGKNVSAWNPIVRAVISALIILLASALLADTQYGRYVTIVLVPLAAMVTLAAPKNNPCKTRLQKEV